MGSPRRTLSSRLSSLPRVRTGLWPVSLARTFSAFCSLSPPSPTPMLTVTLAMRGRVIGLVPAGAGFAGLAAGLEAGFFCWRVSAILLHPEGRGGLGGGHVGLVADGEGVRL